MSSVELLDAFVDRVDRLDPHLNAVVERPAPLMRTAMSHWLRARGFPRRQGDVAGHVLVSQGIGERGPDDEVDLEHRLRRQGTRVASRAGEPVVELLEVLVPQPPDRDLAERRDDVQIGVAAVSGGRPFVSRSPSWSSSVSKAADNTRSGEGSGEAARRARRSP
ncbi:MAG TPA: hypothetical protein VM262_21450 [Acidimicrobiales bacterium]|nr:hypothetical protein [Acidimicrobiales bacterium]